MGIEAEEGPKRIKRSAPKKKPVDPAPLKELKIEVEPAEPVKEEVSEEKKAEGKKAGESSAWDKPTGQLGIDVYQTETHLVIQSAIAGVRPDNLEISIERDVITVKGGREKPFEEQGDYFTQECYWGPFSRQVIMPVEVDPNRAEASMKEGILTIRIPKILREKKRTIKVKI